MIRKIADQQQGLAQTAVVAETLVAHPRHQARGRYVVLGSMKENLGQFFGDTASHGMSRRGDRRRGKPLINPVGVDLQIAQIAVHPDDLGMVPEQ